MKKNIIIACTVGSLLIFIDTFGMSHALTLFIFTGAVFGTDYKIPAVDMLAAYATAFTVVILYAVFGNRIRELFEELTQAPVAKPATRKRSSKRAA